MLILVVVGIRGCLSSQRQAAVEHYDHQAGGLAQHFDIQVAYPLFAALSAPGNASSPVGLETRVNQLRVAADQILSVREPE